MRPQHNTQKARDQVGKKNRGCSFHSSALMTAVGLDETGLICETRKKEKKKVFVELQLFLVNC